VAARFRRRFAVAHAGSRPSWVILYLGVLIGSNFMDFPGSRPLWAAIQATMIYLILSYSTHRRLQPWCPWCRDGGGGSGQDAPIPDPVHTGRRN
jgi:hypothetical protein